MIFAKYRHGVVWIPADCLLPITTQMETEQPEERPKCDYPVSINPANPKEPGRKACGSEQNVFRVIYNDRADKPICRDHLPYEFGSNPVSDAAPWDYGKK